MPLKTALVTGAGRRAGLGFAVARELAAQGYHVVLAARDRSAAEPLAGRLRQEGHEASALRLDLSDAAGMRAAADHLAEAFGHLDVLVNNASAMPDFRVLSALDADMDAVRTGLEVSVIGPWALCCRC